MSLRNLAFVTFTTLFIFTTTAQRNYDYYNRLGIQAGFTLFDINTSDLATKQAGGFMAGFTTRGSFRNQFDLVYGITFFNNKIEVQGHNFGGSGGVYDQQFINYTIQAVQISFLGSLNIVRHHLSLEFGPVLNVNGRMKLDTDRYENYILEGYSTLKASDIEDISKVNFRVMGGLTAGLENFRLSAQYQYGVTNVLKNLNGLELENSDFEGNSGTIILAAVLYF